MTPYTPTGGVGRDIGDGTGYPGQWRVSADKAAGVPTFGLVKQ